MIVKLQNSDHVPLNTTERHTLQRVLHVINGEHFSGAERVQDLLAQRLPQFGYEAGFVCLKNGSFQANRASTSPLAVFEMTSKFDRSAARKVVELARADNYSILHAHTPRSLMVAGMAAKSLRCPLIYHVHSPVGRDSKRWFANRVNTFVENIYLRRVSRMICVSNSIRNYMESLGHAADKLFVAPNGVPTSTLRPRPHSENDFVVGMVALFRPRKGVEILLEAIKHLKKRDVPVRLLAVGPFETAGYEQEIRNLANRFEIRDRVEWTGFEKDVNARLQQMHAMSLPSLFGEGLPMVVLEAMAIGLPVVASRVEGTPEAIRDGVDGYLCPPANSQQLAERLENLYRAPQQWQAMSESSRQRQQECLSDVAMARNVANAYDTL
ncbi:MAG: glycosyltransferase [Pirellulaceae bacterium]